MYVPVLFSKDITVVLMASQNTTAVAIAGKVHLKIHLNNASVGQVDEERLQLSIDFIAADAVQLREGYGVTWGGFASK